MGKAGIALASYNPFADLSNLSQCFPSRGDGTGGGWTKTPGKDQSAMFFTLGDIRQLFRGGYSVMVPKHGAVLHSNNDSFKKWGNLESLQTCTSSIAPAAITVN